MDLENLRRLVLTALRDTSAEKLAAEIGGLTAKSVLNFADGSVAKPRNSQRLAIVKWASRVPWSLKEQAGWIEEPLTTPSVVGASPTGVLASASERTSENLLRLSEISGYAKAVLSMLRSVTAEQARVVESLEPWVLREDRAWTVRATEPAPEGLSPNATGAELEAATRRQLEADAAAHRKAANE